MEERHVVTCFLRNDSEVLLFRRSEDVGSYTAQWGAVAGHVEPEPDEQSTESADATTDRDPDEAARAEIREETGLGDAVTLVRRGESFPVEDTDLNTRWVVHPYLFDCASRDVRTNYETSEYAWVPPTEILRRETVPDLWVSYDRVRPTVETVATDAEHGSAYISVRALEVLRDEAALAVAGEGARHRDWDALVALARDLLAARPAMTVVANRVNQVMDAAATDGATAAAVEQAAESVIEAALAADERAAAVAADHVAGDRVITLSRSGTVRAALLRADPEAVLVAESRPGAEGVGVAESLASEGLDVTLAPDAALPQLLADGDYDSVLVGADTVLPDGAVVNKVGTRLLGLAGAREAVAVHAVAASDKVSPDGEVHIEQGDPDAVYGGDVDVDVAVPLFDVTPTALHDGLLTEDGLCDAEDVAALAAEHDARRDWQS